MQCSCQLARGTESGRRVAVPLGAGSLVFGTMHPFLRHVEMFNNEAYGSHHYRVLGEV